MVGKEFAITKVADEQQIVLGWANVSMTEDGIPIEDYQHDMIEPEELERAAYEYVLKFRDTGEGHNPKLRKKGKLVESVVFTKEKLTAMGIPEGTVPLGWWIGFKIEDKSTWDKVKKGEYTMFSIEGTGEREPIEKASHNPKAMTFDEVFKFNPYHDERGRFTFADAATSFTYAPGKSKAHDNAIQQEKKRHATGSSETKEKPEELPELTGSEKQVKWAKDIRPWAMERAAEWLDVYEDEQSEDEVARMKQRIQNMKQETSAKWYIDHRFSYKLSDYLTGYEEYVRSQKKSVAKTFNEILEILKFNPYHDEKGRFTTGDGAVSFTYKPGASNAHDKAIAREKKRHEEEEKAQHKRKEPTKLTGSEKQVSWASKIRDSRMSYIDREVKALEDNRTGYSPKTNEERKQIYLQAKDYLSSEADAGWWIDTRSKFGDYMDFLVYADNVKRMNTRDKVPFSTLKGSPKEVNWAESIRETSIKALDNYAKTASVDKRRDYERARDYLSSRDEAKWWIDKRKDIDVPSYVMRSFGDIYTTYKKCFKSLTFKEAYMQSISKGAYLSSLFSCPKPVKEGDRYWPQSSRT